MKCVVIVGAGGHAREVAEVLRQSRPEEELTLLGFVVDEPHLHSESVNGLPVLGDWSWFGGTDRRNLAIICAVGSPKIRKQLVERAMALGLSFARAVSLSAHVSPDAKIGDGVMMLASSVASTDCVIGEHAIVNVGATLSHDARLAPMPPSIPASTSRVTFQ